MNSTYTIVNGQRVALHRELNAVAVKYAQGYDHESSMPRSVSKVIGTSSKEESFLPEYGLKIFSVQGATSERFQDEHDADKQLAELNNSPDIEYATPVFRHSAISSLPLYVSNQILLKFKSSSTEEQRAELHASLGGRVIDVLGYTENGFVVEVTGTEASRVVEIANAYAQSPLTEWANPDFIKCVNRRVAVKKSSNKKAVITARGSISNNDPKTQLNRSIEDKDTVEQWHLDKVDITRAWEITRGNSSVKVAITDDGIDVDHIEFSSRVTDQFDFASRTADATPKRADDRHGTPVASVAVAGGVRAIGIAPECSLMAVRTSGFLGSRDEADLFQWCTDQGAAVINCSWGPPDNEGPFPLGDATRAAIDYSVTHGRNGLGTPVVFAAGNGNETVTEDGYAANPQVIAVAACDSEDKRSWYSDRGPEIFICAPSNGGSRSIFTADRQGSAGYNPSRGGPSDNQDYFDSFGGTSSAAPLVSGVIGLMISANPQLTEAEIREILRETADTILGDSEDFYDRGGHSDSFGYGRVNAGAAVAEAASRSSTEQTPTISAPDTIPADGTAPSFEVEAGGRALYAIEVATEAALFDYNAQGARRNSNNFFGSWERGLESSSPYTLPADVWASLDKTSGQLFYRAHVADDEQWSNYGVTTSDDEALNAPKIIISDTQIDGLNNGPVISAPNEVNRTSSAPTFEVNKAGRKLFAIELATDPALFNFNTHGDQRNSANFYASWEEKLSETTTFTIPESAWQSLNTHSRIWYRAHVADDSSWTNYAVTTSDSEAMTAPSFEVTGSLLPSEVIYPSGARFNTISDTEHLDYIDPNQSGVPLIETSGKRNTRLSANFRLSEFVSSNNDFARIAPELIDAIQTVRETVGKAIKIDQGYTRASINQAHASGLIAQISSRHVTGPELMEIAQSVLQPSTSVSVDGNSVSLEISPINNRSAASPQLNTVSITGPESMNTVEPAEFYLRVARPSTVWIELASSVRSMQEMRNTQDGLYQIHRVELADFGVFQVPDNHWDSLSGTRFLHYRASTERPGQGHARGQWHTMVLPAAASTAIAASNLEYVTDLMDRSDHLTRRVS